MNGGRYIPWKDAYGVPIAEAARVEQVGVHKGHGGLPSRWGQFGTVAERNHTRVAVRFDGETELVTLRPYLLRVIEEQGNTTVDDLTEPTEDQVTGFHWHAYVRRAAAQNSPRPAEREARLAQQPAAVLAAPLLVADWTSNTTRDQGGPVALWSPVTERWTVFNQGDPVELHAEVFKAAAQGRSVYAAVRTAAGFLEVYAEAVTSSECPVAGEHDEQPGGGAR